jgi:hypothetical protein
MSRLMKCGLLVLLMVFFCGVNFASAADQDRTRDRKKAKSCQSFSIEQERGTVIAADRIKKKDRKRDRSCQSYTVQDDEGMTLAADQKRDRKKDGSC